MKARTILSVASGEIPNTTSKVITADVSSSSCSVFTECPTNDSDKKIFSPQYHTKPLITHTISPAPHVFTLFPPQQLNNEMVAILHIYPSLKPYLLNWPANREFLYFHSRVLMHMIENLNFSAESAINTIISLTDDKIPETYLPPRSPSPKTEMVEVD